MSVNHTHVVTSVKNRRRRREISTKVYEEIDTEIFKKSFRSAYMLLDFYFLNFGEFRASILQIQPPSTPVGLALFAGTHFQRHEVRWGDLKHKAALPMACHDGTGYFFNAKQRQRVKSKQLLKKRVFQMWTLPTEPRTEYPFPCKWCMKANGMRPGPTRGYSSYHVTTDL